MLSFGALIVATAETASISLPGWTIVRIAIPKGGEIKDASVELETASHEKLTLARGIRSYGGITLEQVEWTGEPRRARVILQKGEDRAELIAEAGKVGADETPARPQRQIEIEARFIEITKAVAKNLPLLRGANAPVSPGKEALADGLIAVLDDEAFQVELRNLTQKKGVDVLTTPRVTTKPGQRAEIMVFHEFRYPTDWDAAPAPKKGWIPKTFETKNLGATFMVEPMLREDEAIDLKLEPQLVELLGFVDFVTKKPLAKANRERLFERALDSGMDPPKRRAEPVFSTRKAAVDCTLKSGYTAVFVLSATEVPAGFVSPSDGRVLLGLVSARWMTAEAAAPLQVPIDPPPGPDRPPGEAGPILEAKPVAGKPGYVTSPHAPNAGFIDVRGFEPGTELKDPYSGKILRVPAELAKPADPK